jgi:hypothetical protein
MAPSRRLETDREINGKENLLTMGPSTLFSNSTIPTYLT